MSVILHYNYNFFLIFFLLVPFGSKVVSFFTGMNQCVTQCWWHCKVKWGGATSAGPPSPSAEGEEQWEEGSGKCVGLAGSGKKASFLGETG